MGADFYCFIINVPSETCLLAVGAVFRGFAAGGGRGGETLAAGGGVGALMTAGLTGAGLTRAGLTGAGLTGAGFASSI